MINSEIAEIFNNMAAYIQMENDKNSFFRSRALRTAAESLEKFPYDLSKPEWYQDPKKLESIEGIGKSTAYHIQEYVLTGKIQDYEDMKNKSPVNLEELLKVQGVGPKTIIKLYNELGVTDLNSLKEAALGNKISLVEGFGDKSQKKILDSIEFAITNKDRILISDAEYISDHLLNYMRLDPNILNIEAVGSLRRKSETIGDIDILAVSEKPIDTMDYFTKYPLVEKVLSRGETKSSIWIKNKIQIDIRIIDKNEWGSALQYFTGSKEHNISLRNHAISMEYKLSEYGLFQRKDNKLIESKSEVNIYNKLNLQYIPPELRENENEIEFAKINKLPKLLELTDIKGDMQMHTTFSDGINSISEMGLKGIELGYDYIGITDHFGKLKIANAIDESEFNLYLDSIKKADDEIKGIKILAGAEVEIDKNGNLEFDLKLLEKLDFVIGAVHFNTNMEPFEMTERLLKALDNKLIKFIAHPTGRLLGKRKGYEFDYNQIFTKAKENNIAMEINAHPARLDLNFKLAKLANEIGCKIIINTDSHSLYEMENMKYGVFTARKAWITKESLLYYPFE